MQVNVVVCLFLGLAVSVVNATGFTNANQTMEHLLSLISSSRPVAASPEFDCAWRKLAFEYAPTLQPWLSKQKRSELFDALELHALCGEDFNELDEGNHTEYATFFEPRSDAYNVFVDANKGNDSNSGSEAAPLRTIAAAVVRTRKHSQEARAIYLRGGIHRVKDTILLQPVDSGLNISSFRGENATVSGGRLLTGLQWKKTTVNGKDVYAASTRGQDLPHGVSALQIGGQRATLARYPNANPELDLFPKGYITAQSTWTPPTYHGKTCDPDRQCGVSKNVTIPVDASKEWHGMFQNYTVGVGGACERYIDFRSPWCSGDFYLLRQFPEMHTRSPSGLETGTLLPNAAKYNTDQAAGKATVHAWRPGHWYTWMFEVSEFSPGTHVDKWTVYPNTNAISGEVPSPGGSTPTVKFLGNFNTQEGCSNACKTLAVETGACHSWTWHEPSFAGWGKGCYGHIDTAFDPTPQHGIVSGRGPYTTGPTLTFSTERGGNQGGEGNNHGGEWFIEGVEAELDAPNEFYWDEHAERLLFLPNATASITIDTDWMEKDVVVPTLDVLFDLKGTMATPVTDITFQDLSFAQNRPTFMEPRTNPSGGDWSLERQGALRLEGTENVVIRGNLFTKLDTNAISLNG